MPVLSIDERDCLVELLEACRAISEPGTRAAVIRRLRDKTQILVPSSPNPRVELTELVAVCASYEGGVAALREAVWYFESDSIAMGELDKFLVESRVQSLRSEPDDSVPMFEPPKGTGRVRDVGTHGRPGSDGDKRFEQVSTFAPPIRWLHCSDLHAGAGDPAQRQQRLVALQADIEEMTARIGWPDLILFSGDLAVSGREYDEVDRVLEAILGAVAQVAPDAPAPLLFAVPGNHDVVRPSADDEDDRLYYACKVLRNYGNRVDPDARALHRRLWGAKRASFLSELFSPYEAWKRARVVMPMMRHPDVEVHTSFFPGDVSAIVTKGSFRLGLVGLNSAWVQYGAGDFDKKLHIPVEQFHAALAGDSPPEAFFERCDRALLLMHHPPSWLSPAAHDVFLSEIFNSPERFSLCLFGHMHSAYPQVQSSEEASLRAYFQAPSLCGREHWGAENEQRSFGYAWGEIFAHGAVRVWPRELQTDAHGHKVVVQHSSVTLDENGATWLRKPPATLDGDSDGQVEGEFDDEEATGVYTDFSYYLATYAAWARKHFEYLPMRGLGGMPLPLRLEDVHVPLELTVASLSWPDDDVDSDGDGDGDRDDGDGSDHSSGRWGADRGVRLDRAFSRAGESRHLFVRGDPGTGKTTALSKLLWSMLNPNSPSGFDSAALGLPPNMVPIFLRLRSVARWMHTLDDFGDVLERELSAMSKGAFPDGFGRWLWSRGRVVLLLDGLDEIVSPKARADICARIEQQLARVSPEHARAVVSSRFAGLKEEDGVAFDAERFLHLDVSSLDDAQIASLVNRWFAAAGALLERVRNEGEEVSRFSYQTQADGLLRALKQPAYANRQLKELVSTPLFLTLLCVVYCQGQRIPEERVAFFDKCLEVLLVPWARHREQRLLLSKDEALELLHQVAWYLHVNHRRDDLREDELRGQIERPLRQMKRHRERRLNVSTALDWLKQTAGVVMEYGTSPAEYGLMHLSMQEYLAARYAGKHSEEGIAVLAEHFGRSWWREVTLLFVGLREYKHFAPLMEEVLARHSLLAADEEGQPLRALVYECLQQSYAPELGPFLAVIGDRERSVEERVEALTLVQDQDDSELLKLASAVALERGDDKARLREVAAYVESRASSHVGDEHIAEPVIDVVVMCARHDREIASALMRVMSEWGWRVQRWRSNPSGGVTDAKCVLVISEAEGHGPWQRLRRRQWLVQAVRRRGDTVMVVQSARRAAVLPSFMETCARVDLGERDGMTLEIVAMVAAALQVEIPVQAHAQLAARASGSVEVRAPRRAEVEKSTGMRLLYVPEGRYRMGSADDDELARKNEKPAQMVAVAAFWMGETPVTNRQYGALLEAPSVAEPAYWRDRNYNQAEQPVVGVSWFDAVRYCNALSRAAGLAPFYKIVGAGDEPEVTGLGTDGYRLPTEAEWEYACRAETRSRWCFGDDEGRLDKYAWHGFNSMRELQPVGRKKPNPWGFYDIHGNQGEWCWDWFGFYPRPGKAAGKLRTWRVVRGGSFVSEREHLRSASRSWNVPSLRVQVLGFRVARSVTLVL